MMSWEDLRYVLAVARHGTLSEGAKSLRVNATTVSRRIKALEEATGAPLFEKLKHGAKLTAAGEEMVAVAREVERLTNELDARINGLQQKIEGVIRVSSLDTLIQRWMPRFADFQRENPAVQLEISSGFNAVDLTRREADLAVRVAREAPEHLIGRKHATVHYACYASEDLIEEVQALRGKKKRTTRYSDYPFLSWDLGLGRAGDLWVEQYAEGAEIRARFERMPAMLDAVSQGMGACCLPCFAADARPELRRIGDYFEGAGFVWVLTHPALRGAARIQAMTRSLSAWIRDDLDLIEGRAPQQPALQF